MTQRFTIHILVHLSPGFSESDLFCPQVTCRDTLSVDHCVILLSCLSKPTTEPDSKRSFSNSSDFDTHWNHLEFLLKRFLGSVHRAQECSSDADATDSESLRTAGPEPHPPPHCRWNKGAGMLAITSTEAFHQN